MKFLAAVLSGVVGVGVLLMSGPAMAGVSDRVDPVQRRATADVTAPASGNVAVTSDGGNTWKIISGFTYEMEEFGIADF